MMSTTSLIATQTPAREVLPTVPVAVVPKPSPGTWRHPKLTEIAARQSQTTFSDRKLQQALYNTIAFLASFGLKSWLDISLRKLDALFSLPSSSTPAFLLIWTLRFYFLFNITQSIRPLFPSLSIPDTITDIPLTPSQRALLGLDPTATPPTPLSADTKYTTPPRYRRSSSSTSFTSPSPSTQLLQNQTDRRSISANYSSPLSTSRHTLGFSPGPFRSTNRTASASNSPFSPSASPLLHKAIAQQNSNRETERHPFGTSTSTSRLGRTQSLRERERERGSSRRRTEREQELGTPSPRSGEFQGGGPGAKRSPGLNYKWMYERGVAGTGVGIGQGKGLVRSETMQF